MGAMTVARAIKRYEHGAYTEVLDDVLKEYVLSIYLRDTLLVTLICTPEYLEELVVGHLYSDGLISSADDLASIEIDGQVARVTPRANTAPTGETEDSGVIVTDSGDFVGVPDRFRQRGPGAAAKGLDWDPEVVLANASLLLEKSKLFRRTGNIHSVMICRGTRLLYFCEDIGRYNAFDKCVGRALKDKTDLSDACVYTSGRIPSSIVLKTLRAGIPMLVSRSAPTDASLALAAEHGLTLLGFAGPTRFNLYSPE